MRLAASLVGIVAVFASGTRAQEARTVSDGPLLCFQTRALDNRGPVHHVLDLAGTAPPRAFWSTTSNSAVLHRLDRTRVVAANYHDPYALFVVDLESGAAREIAPGAPHSFVGQHGDDVLYIGDDRHGKNDNFLYAVPWRAPADRRRIAEVHFDRVPVIHGNVAIGIEPGDVGVWIVSLAGGACRRVWTTPQGASHVRVAPSPGGQRLAIGCVSAEGTGELLVVDIGNGSIVNRWRDLPIHVSPFSSNLPTVEVGWQDDLHVVCSETRGDRMGGGNFVHVSRHVSTDEPPTESVYASIGLSHQPPAVPNDRRPAPCFEIRQQGHVMMLHRVGDERSLATANLAKHVAESVGISPDGQFATFKSSRVLQLFTTDGAAPRSLTHLACGLSWLPAAR